MNAEVRETTRSPCTRLKALISSSVIPSLKNSFSGSALMLTNGSTAIAVIAGADGGSTGPAPSGASCRSASASA